MVSRVPASLAPCPCHSPETPFRALFSSLSSSPGPSSVGKVGSMPASLLGQKTPTGLPQGHWNPGIPPVISILPPPPLPQSRMNPQGSPLLGVQSVPHLSASALKRARSSVHPLPLPGCPERLHVIIRHSIFVHVHSLLPSLEAANWGLGVGVGLPR